MSLGGTPSLARTGQEELEKTAKEADELLMANHANN